MSKKQEPEIQVEIDADGKITIAGYGFEALHYDIKGRHSMISSWGGMSPPKIA